ncbi:RidA family protein [Oceanidesulfovibrio marinus]|uniref:RidA family protein n=1 Tax=Oceanidesulfovibrio marinus TaxID=370038 RepID=A0A6P1ZKY4_9BACT|nr:RidA family protein [Oceanidesulfovibrio marinus]QJT09914.1 RidA family protein [Oceanidesulfovibrio marinus]TVM35970.1 hypothetical protein DQK91_04795 [Oceanidesulfovibrio marinus]
MKVVHSDKAPKALGPYAQAIETNGMIFCSGQTGIDPATNTLVDGLEAQTRQVLSNLGVVLQEAGSSPSRVIKTTVFLADMQDFPVMNEIYGEFFGEHKPARTTVQVAGLPLDARVEIECIALAG